MDKLMFACLLFGLASCLTAQMLPGRRLYNSQSEMCCDGVVFKKSGGKTACCGTTPYDPGEYACCGNSLVVLPPEMRQLGQYSCCNDHNGRFKSLYDSNKMLCCNGELYPLPNDDAAQVGCCNGRPFDAAKSNCNGVATFIRNQAVIAGPYNAWVSARRRRRSVARSGSPKRLKRAESFLCPGGGDVFGNGGTNKPCCLLANKLYDPGQQACCHNEVIDITQDDRQARFDTCCLRFPFTDVMPESQSLF